MEVIESKLRLWIGERERKGKISGYGVKISGDEVVVKHAEETEMMIAAMIVW